MKAQKLGSVIRMALVVGAGASVGCADTANAFDAAAGDVSDVAASDVSEVATGDASDVRVSDASDAPLLEDVVDATDVSDVTVEPSDAPPEASCGMCGCTFTGRLEGTGTLQASHCEGADADGGPAPDPATCAIDCGRACASVIVTGEGIMRPWGGASPGGGAPGMCSRASATTVSCVAFVPCGREPRGLARTVFDDPDPVAAYLARSAWLEAASVTAFEGLAAELRAHGAPASLVRAAERSARDERRHAVTMRALAEARGARVPDAVVGATAARSLEDIALENAAEGCARETWGAVVASWQHTHARDAAVREAMGEIARDETRHAAFSWALDRWINTRLDDGARTRVREARTRAWGDVLRSLDDGASTAPCDLLGLPGPAAARAMARATCDALAV